MTHLLWNLWNSILGGADRLTARIWPLQSTRACRPEDVAWWERSARLLFLLALVCGFPVMMNRALHRGGTDFPAFYESGRHIIEHGTRHPHSEAARYLPSADAAWAVIALLPYPVAASSYYLLGCWSWIGLLSTVHRRLLPKAGENTRRRATLLAGLLGMPLAVDGLCLGSFHIFMVWLMVAGLAAVAGGQWRRGGLLLGLSIWVKLLPVLGIGYLILKRRWRPAALAVLTVVVLDVVLSLAAYGPREAWSEHAKWWHDEGSGAAARQLTESKVVDEDRLSNQSIIVILRRLLTNFGFEPDNPRNEVSLARLSATQLRLAYLAVMAALGLATLWVLRRPGDRLSPGQWSDEIAVMLLATIWCSPVVWSYHPTSAVPALALVLAQMARHSRLAVAAAVMWIVGMALFAVPEVRSWAT